MNNTLFISRIGQHIQKKLTDKKSFLVAVTGPGCSGKTEFCRELTKHLPDSSIFFLDGYYYDVARRRKRGHTGAHSSSLKISRLLNDLEKIRSGVPFKKLISKVSVEDNREGYAPSKYNIIDGLSALLIPDTRLYDFIIYIECEDSVQLKRRIEGDIRIRKRPEEEMSSIFKERICQFNKFVLPKRECSNIILKSDDKFKLSFVKEDMI